MKNSIGAPVLTKDHTISIVTANGRRYRFGIGFVPVGETGRKEFGGPMLPGPWAYTYGLCIVFDNHGGSGAESKRLQAEGLELRATLGDAVEVDGVTYKITALGSEWIDLVKL